MKKQLFSIVMFMDVIFAAGSMRAMNYGLAATAAGAPRSMEQESLVEAKSDMVARLLKRGPKVTMQDVDYMYHGGGIDYVSVDLFPGCEPEKAQIMARLLKACVRTDKETMLRLERSMPGVIDEYKKKYCQCLKQQVHKVLYDTVKVGVIDENRRPVEAFKFPRDGNHADFFTKTISEYAAHADNISLNQINESQDIKRKLQDISGHDDNVVVKESGCHCCIN
ncbi:MAG: hypothetical protein NTX86_00085 [Candidatus Dependentiae bacterium]|nr:hypothetical protein [Candidatus Dependentiae bacterium]